MHECERAQEKNHGPPAPDKQTPAADRSPEVAEAGDKRRKVTMRPKLVERLTHCENHFACITSFGPHTGLRDGSPFPHSDQ